MNIIKKRVLAVAFAAVAVCAFAGNISAAQYGDNVVTDAGNYTSPVTYDVNTDGNFDICDLVSVNEAIGNTNVKDKHGLLLDSKGNVIKGNVDTLRRELLNK